MPGKGLLQLDSGLCALTFKRQIVDQPQGRGFIIGIGRGGWPAYGKIEMGSLFDGAEPVRRLLRQVTRGEPG